MFLAKYRGYYYLYYNNEAGKRKKVSCRTKYKPEALKFLSNFKLQSHTKKEAIQVLTLSELKKEILKYVSCNLRIGTVKIYRIAFDNLIRILNDKPIKLITTKDIEFYKSERLKEVKPATVNIDIGTLKAIFNIAIRLEMLSFNPVKNIKKISIPQKEHLAFNDIQVKMILNSIENQTLKNVVSFALLTGCRLNEIINLQWKDINFAERILIISNKEDFKTKSGKMKYIPLSDNLHSLFLEMQGLTESGNNILSLNNFNPDNYVFANPQGYKFSKNYVSMEFKKILRKLNFEEKYHFHCLRHTFITNLIKSGVNINYVKEIAGHSEIQTTMNYIHIATNDLREAVNKINIS